MSKNIYTTFDKILRRKEKEKLLKQKGFVIWLTGLSSSGKTTIASGLEKILHSEGKLTQVLDGDNVRAGLNNNIGFTDGDRKENIRRAAEAAKLFKDCGVITFCCFICPTNSLLKLAKKIIGKKDFIHIYIAATIKDCEQRDVKGLYAKARKGEIKNFTGVNSPFEERLEMDLKIDTKKHTVEESVKLLYNFIKKRI
jgi:adenylylsulfate kinase